MTTLRLRNGRLTSYPDFDALFRPLASEVARTGFTPAAEVNRDGEDALVSLELPGLDLEQDVTVEVDGGALVVRGERRDERAEERDGRRLREVRYGSFRRSFTLPSHVTGEDVTATYDKGVLSVRVAGAYRGSTARRIPVTAGVTAPEVEGGK
jgi:HSP20 family molecular chaperone IbpA